MPLPKWLVNAYDVVFPCDGHDVFGRTVNGNPITPKNPLTLLEPDDDVRGYYSSFLIRATSFFGIPNRMRRNSKATKFNLFLNFIFFPDEGAPKWQRVFQIIVMCTGIPIAFSILSIIASTLIHTVMILTELLPLALQNFIKHKNPKGDSIVLTALEKFAGALHFIGRAITSPITGARMAAREGDSLSSKIILTILSVAITTVAYTVLFPLAAKFAIANFPAAISWLTNALLPLVPYLEPIFSLTTYIPAVTWIASTLSLSPVIVGFSAVLGFAAATVGEIINTTLNWLLNKFFNNTDLKFFGSASMTNSLQLSIFSSPQSPASIQLRIAGGTDSKFDHGRGFADSAASAPPSPRGPESTPRLVILGQAASTEAEPDKNSFTFS